MKFDYLAWNSTITLNQCHFFSFAGDDLIYGNEEYSDAIKTTESEFSNIKMRPKRFSIEPYPLKSPKVPSGLVRSLCNLYDKELKTKVNSPTRSSLRNVGKLPGFENYPRSRSKSPNDSKCSTANLSRSRSFNCSSSSTQESSSPSSTSSCQPDIKSSTSSPNSTCSNNSNISSRISIETEEAKHSSFKGLFRSRSWSLRRRKAKIDADTHEKRLDNQSSSHPNAKTETPKRCSPSYSVKSQDSGFSDSGESNHGATSKHNSNEKYDRDKERRQKISLAQQKRLEFLTSTNDEDGDDPNLTQLPTHVDNPIYSYILGPNDTTKDAKDKVASSVGNIASMAEGLRIKRSLMEEENVNSQPNFHRKSVNLTDNLIEANKLMEKCTNLNKKCTDIGRPKSVIIQAKQTSPLVSPKMGTYSIANTSQDLEHNTLVFSTPLRESFRKRQLRPKTMAVFHLDEAKTPSKRASKNPRLKEMKKTSQLRRWSNIEIADVRNNQTINDEEYQNLPSIIQTTEEVDVDEHLRECRDDETLRINNLSQIPAGIDPSMIAVWSQLADFEADIPHINNISSFSYLSNSHKESCGPSNHNDSNIIDHHDKHRNKQRPQRCLEQNLSSTQLSNINSPSLDNTKVLIDDTNQLNATPLSRMESCCVDGTSTRLLVESYCDQFKQKHPDHIPCHEKEKFLAASFSVNNSSRSATLLSIPQVSGTKDANSADKKKYKACQTFNPSQSPIGYQITEERLLPVNWDTINSPENNSMVLRDLNGSQR